MTRRCQQPGTASPGRAGPSVPRTASRPSTGVGVTETGHSAPTGAAPSRSLAQRLPRLPRQLTPWLRPSTLRGAVIETIWGSTHLALYPFGLVRDRYEEPHDRYHLADLAPHQRGLVIGDVEAAGTPILLLHGMFDNRMVFALLRHQLRRRGFGRVFTINYSPTTNDIRSAARDLSGAVEELVARTGYERIHLIGHSLGGLIARYYVQRLGGDERVHTLVTLGTPHQGSLLAHAMPIQLGRQLRPGSGLFAELAEPAPECRTRFAAYYSDTDQIVVPAESGRLEHPDLIVRNVPLRGVGHMSLPILPRVVQEISAMLSQLDSDGTTLHAGVTRLSPAG